MIYINGHPQQRAIDAPVIGTHISVKQCNEIADRTREFFAKRGIETNFAGSFKYARQPRIGGDTQSSNLT